MRKESNCILLIFSVSTIELVMIRFSLVRSPSARFMSAKEFLNYVNASPSPYHAVDETRKMLKAANYKEWSEVSSLNELLVGGE